MSEHTALVIVAVVNAWLLLMASGAWRLGKENYDRLPDRIPIHFGFSGKADQYARKSRISVFWAPVLCVCMQVFMSGMFLMIYKAEGEDSILVLLAGTGLTFALCWLLIRTQTLIIGAALGSERSAWRVLAGPLALMLLTTVLFSALPFYMMGLPAEYRGAVFCEALEKDLTPVRPSDAFSANAKTIYILTEWKNLNGNVQLEYRWIGPDGAPVFTGKFQKKYNHIKSNRRMWYRLNLDHFRAEGMDVTGEWSVEVIKDGRKAAREKFRVEQVR